MRSCRTTALLLFSALSLMLLTGGLARAEIVYTITDNGSGGFNIAKSTAPDPFVLFDPADDVLVKVVNNSTALIQKIHIAGNGSDPFGFDSTGPWNGSYQP